MEFAEALLVSIVTASTPLLLAAIGELIVERSGVLNLGVEGMMIMGAVCAFATSLTTGNPYLGIIAGMAGGMAMSVLFGFLTLILVANQVATGLALTLLGLGLSGMIGEHFVGTPGIKLPTLDIPVLSDIPVIGHALFGQDLLFYVSIALVIGVAYFLFRSRAGLVLRAVGENHHSAHALGYNVIRVRYLAVLFGGLCAGLSGAYLSLVYTNLWIENMTAGRGWIALALVVFASWLPAPRRRWRLSLRLRAHPAISCPRCWLERSVPVARILALSGHHCRACRDFTQPLSGPCQYAILSRSVFRAGSVGLSPPRCGANKEWSEQMAVRTT